LTLWPEAHRGRFSRVGSEPGFAQRSQARQSVWPNRIHVLSCLYMSCRYRPVVHLRQLPTPCCHDAVAFDCRRVNVPSDRDFHPVECTPSQAHDRAVHGASALPRRGRSKLLHAVSEHGGPEAGSSPRSAGHGSRITVDPRFSSCNPQKVLAPSLQSLNNTRST
jgi:hypothetical protein